MSATQPTGKQIRDATIQRVDLDVSTVGQSVITKIVQGTGLTISSTGGDAGTGDVTINVAVAIAAWQEITAATVTAVVNTGYVLNNAAQLVLTLPATFAVGSQITVVGKGAGGWKIAQPAGQNIVFGKKTSTTGTGGSLASTFQYDAVELIGIVANTTWSVFNARGNIVLV